MGGKNKALSAVVWPAMHLGCSGFRGPSFSHTLQPAECVCGNVCGRGLRAEENKEPHVLLGPLNMTPADTALVTVQNWKHLAAASG